MWGRGPYGVLLPHNKGCSGCGSFSHPICPPPPCSEPPCPDVWGSTAQPYSHPKNGPKSPSGSQCLPLGLGSLWGFDIMMKGFGVGVPMGFCSPKCGVGVPKCPHLGWGPYGVLLPQQRVLGSGFLWGLLRHRKGFGVGVLWGFDVTAKGFGVGVTMGV